jgi:hypothetical protein
LVGNGRMRGLRFRAISARGRQPATRNRPAFHAFRGRGVRRNGTLPDGMPRCVGHSMESTARTRARMSFVGWPQGGGGEA